MKQLNLLILAACATLLPAIPAAAQQKSELRFGTAGIGGATYIYAAGMADLANPKLPAGTSISVLPIAGGLGNLKLVQAGEMELGLTFDVTTAEACGGFGSFKEKQDKVRAVIGGLDAFYFSTFVTKSSDVTSWDQIVAAKNKFHLLTTRPGATGEVAVRQVIAALGSSKAEIEKKGGTIEATERAGAAETIRDGQAGGWAHIVPKGHPAATQIVTINDMIMLPLPDNVIKTMVDKYGWTAATLPADTFKGQTQPLQTVKTASNIVTNASVPEEAIYQFTKAVMENVDKLPKIHAALGTFNPKTAADPILNGKCPLHPGAARYYREAGLTN
jgi:TRAP transporter TAXI family solute receptor